MEKAMTNPNISKLENNKLYKKALERQALGDGIEALKLFTELSEGGHMLAQYQLAKIYLDEHGDALEGVRLFEMAGKRGHIDSAFNLGTLFENGDPIVKSLADAYFWYRIAARGGDEESQYILDKIDSDVYDKESDTFEYSLNGRLYWELVGPALQLEVRLQESDSEEMESEPLSELEELNLKQLKDFLASRWPDEYRLAKITAKKEGFKDVFISHISEQVGSKGYAYLADIIEFLYSKDIRKEVRLAEDAEQSSDEKLDDLLAKFDKIMADEEMRDDEVNSELAIKANKLAFNDYDPDLNTEVELVLYLRDIYPDEFGQAALNQSLDEGGDVEFPTLGRVAELISKENEAVFLKNIVKFYSTKGYKK
jgi:hypothetical protein